MGDYYDTLVVLMTAQQQHMDADTMARTISLKAKKATSIGTIQRYDVCSRPWRCE